MRSIIENYHGTKLALYALRMCAEKRLHAHRCVKYCFDISTDQSTISKYFILLITSSLLFFSSYRNLMHILKVTSAFDAMTIRGALSGARNILSNTLNSSVSKRLKRKVCAWKFVECTKIVVYVRLRNDFLSLFSNDNVVSKIFPIQKQTSCDHYDFCFAFSNRIKVKLSNQTTEFFLSWSIRFE